MLEIGLGMIFFTVVILALVFMILGAKSKLVASDNVNILINDRKTIQSSLGVKLLMALAEAHIFVASACGGKGTCGQCRVRVLEGGGAILPTETSLIMKREAQDGVRLACQVPVKQDLTIHPLEEPSR